MHVSSLALRRHPFFTPSANLTVRAAGLAMRLGLVAYLARFLGIAEVGQFGLIQGAAGLTPVVLGWGVTYFLGREVVGHAPLQAGRLVRDRLILTLVSLTVAGAVATALILAQVIAAPSSAFWIAAILALEAIAFDLHFALINVGRPLVANFLLLLRSGLWVVPAAGLGMLFPTLRTLDFVLLCWTIFLVIHFGTLLQWFGGWPLAAIARAPIDVGWVTSRIRGARLIYLNDLGVVGMAYLDRYIVHSMLDLRATGLFVLHWAIANAIHVLTTAATVQLSLPILVQAYRQGGEPQWRNELQALARRVLAIGAPLALLTIAVAVYCLPVLLDGDSPIDGTLLALMLGSVVIRLLADAFNYGLYSRGRDRALALINIGGAVFSAALSLVLLPAFGLNGVGLAMLVTSILLLAIRVSVLLAQSKPDVPDPMHG